MEIKCKHCEDGKVYNFKPDYLPHDKTLPDTSPCIHCKGSGAMRLMVPCQGKEDYFCKHECRGCDYWGVVDGKRPLKEKEIEHLIYLYQTIDNVVDIEMVVKWIRQGSPVFINNQPVSLEPAPREG